MTVCVHFTIVSNSAHYFCTCIQYPFDILFSTTSISIMTRQTQYSTREYAREPSGLQPRINPEQQYLEMKFSDDSSVFSGLAEQENEMKHMNQLRSPVKTQKPKGILRASSLSSPKYVAIDNEKPTTFLQIILQGSG